MKIMLSYDKSIRDVQEEFQKEYPFLKLEFFRKPHQIGEGSPQKEIVPSSSSLLSVTGVIREGIIEINPTDTVDAVESLFQHKFYLPVQVFRKSKDAWLETTSTDDRDLREQNEMGRQASETASFDAGEYAVDWDAL